MKTRLATLFLAAAALACKVDNNASIQVVALCAPPAETCGTEGGCDAYLASQPFLYLEGGTNYLELFVEMTNQLADNADPSAGRLNTNDAYLEKYRLTYRSAFFNYADYDYPASGILRAGSTSAPIVRLIPETISAPLSAAMAAAGATTGLVEVGLTITGHYASGDSFEVGGVTFPVDVHNDAFPGYTCPNATDTITYVCPNTAQTAAYTCTAAPAAP
ncbi:hypothetical protein [Anaeromyxobacter dehalogenans]|uniref:Lipoprotein n=1 Tax=Anaeromyxobacter dehalogenans (strain 2CP-C) TaxID=290397 RepID=Q2INN7_ANADE|nr:hypothetical protein [Anaeromyxobacter dehalogenans]ABC80422.1 hypothetical protein Adeh_0646 [Anaeromyxobacter dehalogenans 2CP-C]